MDQLLLMLVWLLLSAVAFQRGDVVAFLGGTDVVAAQFTGHLESRLAAEYREVRFRNLGWDGDTVYAQPREYGFPTLDQVLRRAGATVIMLQFGRTEALDGTNRLSDFAAAYDRILTICTGVTARLMVVTPPPFERGSAFVPDLARKNPDLAAFVTEIQRIAKARSLPVVDLFN